MLDLQEKVAEVTHFPFENFIMPSVAVIAAVAAVAVASVTSSPVGAVAAVAVASVTSSPVGGRGSACFWLLASASRPRCPFWGRFFRLC